MEYIRFYRVVRFYLHIVCNSYIKSDSNLVNLLERPTVEIYIDHSNCTHFFMQKLEISTIVKPIDLYNKSLA